MEMGAHKATHSNQTPNTKQLYLGSQSVGDNFHGQKGNSPDRQLRSLINPKFVKVVKMQ